MKIVIETTEYISKQLHDGTMSDADFEKLYKQARNHLVLDKNCDLISRKMLIEDFEKDPPDPEGVDEWIDIVNCQPRIL